MRETERNDLATNNKRNYRNRLKNLYTFWQEKYPQYYAVGVRALTEEELGDEDMFWWKNKHDLIYTGLNVQFVKAFLAHKKKKENGKTCSQAASNNHPCTTCKAGAHNLCAQEFGLKGGDEDSSIFYCSLSCKHNK